MFLNKSGWKVNLTLLQLQFQNFVPNQAAFLYHMISTLCANDDYSQCVFTSPSMVILETHLHTLDLFYQTSRLLVSLCSVKIVRHPSFKLRQSETNLSSNHSHRPQSSSHPNHWPSMTPPPWVRVVRSPRVVRGGVWLEFEPVLAPGSCRVAAAQLPCRDVQQTVDRRYFNNRF